MLEACKNPFDTRDRNYAPLAPLPPPMSPKDAQAVIERTRKKFNYHPERAAMQAHRDEAANREPLPYVETPPDVKIARMEAIRRRLDGKEFPNVPE